MDRRAHVVQTLRKEVHLTGRGGKFQLAIAEIDSILNMLVSRGFRVTLVCIITLFGQCCTFDEHTTRDGKGIWLVTRETSFEWS